MLRITKRTIRKCEGNLEFASIIISNKKDLETNYKNYRLFNRSLSEIQQLREYNY